MSTQYTPVFNLPYPQIGDPVKDGAAAIEGIAKKTETALVNGSFPSSNPDIASITARLNALDLRVTKPKAHRFTGSQSVANGTLVPTITNAPITGANSAFITRLANNHFTINETGIYTMSGLIATGGFATGLREVTIRKGGAAVISVSQLSGQGWEFSFSGTIYVTAGSDFNVSYNQNSGTQTWALDMTVVQVGQIGGTV